MSQALELLELLKDGKGHRTDEILIKVYGGSHLGLSRIGARVSDIIELGYTFIDEDGTPLIEYRKRKGWFDKENPTLYWYRIKIDRPSDNFSAPHYDELNQPVLFPLPERKQEVRMWD